MPVTNCSPEFDLYSAAWGRIADVLEGSDAVKRNATTYLPMLAGHREEPESYSEYVTNALFMNGSALTLSAYIGAIFRKDMTLEVPARIKPRLDNINGAGDSIHTFAKRVMRHVLAFGRYGLLVEAAAPSDDGSSNVIDFRDPAANLPWIAGYEARDIRCWRTRTVAGRPVLDQLILHEQVEVQDDDEFGFKLESQYRVLDLDETGMYRVRLFREINNTHEIVASYEPRPRGQRIPYIPFVFINPTDLRPSVSKPPLLDLVDVNLSHFKSSAEIEQARSRIAWPLPVVISDADAMPLKFGGNWALWLPPGSDAKFLEFNGKGLSDLSAALDEKASYMATLGARLLQEPKRAAEAAETHYLRASSENSTLASCANTASDGLKAALTHMAEWVAATGEVNVELNTDFFDVPVSPQTVTALMSAVQAGLYPMDEFLWVLKQGEMMRQETTIEDARRMNEQDQPVLLGRAEDLAEINRPPQPAPAQGNGGNDDEEDRPTNGGNGRNGRTGTSTASSSGRTTNRADIGPRRRTSS